LQQGGVTMHTHRPGVFILRSFKPVYLPSHYSLVVRPSHCRGRVELPVLFTEDYTNSMP
jgi:hypothetical protein